MIGIIDYGSGNLASVLQIFQRSQADAKIINNPDMLLEVDSIVLPGVGSFKTASSNLRAVGWDTAIINHLDKGHKLLGICLGMQLLFERGSEGGNSLGLGIIPGFVEKLPHQDDFCLPHMGWNTVSWSKEHPVTQGIRSGLDFYHVHSYHCLPSNTAHVLSTTEYGVSIVNSVALSNIVAFQFHPEKSQPLGLKIIHNFINWCS